MPQEDKVDPTTTDKNLIDKPDGDEVESEITPLAPRDEILAQIEAKRQAQKEAELEDDSEDEEDQPLPDEDEEEDSEDEPEEDSEDPDQDEDEDEPSEPMVKVKVYGREFEVPKSKVDAAGGKAEYQKQLAAAEKAEVLRQKEEVEAEKQKLAEERKALEASKKVPSTKDEPTKDLPSDDRADETEVRQVIAKAAESLFDGDTETFTDNILGIINQRQGAGQTVDVNAIVEQAVQATRETMTREQRQQELVNARRTFVAEYPELVQNEELFNKVNYRTISLQQEYPDKAPVELLRIAGDEVSKLYLDNQPGDNTEQQREKLEEKKAEKRAMQKPVGGSGKSQKKPEPKQETRSDYINRLKESRGQV